MARTPAKIVKKDSSSNENVIQAQQKGKEASPPASIADSTASTDTADTNIEGNEVTKNNNGGSKAAKSAKTTRATKGTGAKAGTVKDKKKNANRPELASSSRWHAFSAR